MSPRIEVTQPPSLFKKYLYKTGKNKKSLVLPGNLVVNPKGNLLLGKIYHKKPFLSSNNKKSRNKI